MVVLLAITTRCLSRLPNEARSYAKELEEMNTYRWTCTLCYYASDITLHEICRVVRGCLGVRNERPIVALDGTDESHVGACSSFPTSMASQNGSSGNCSIRGCRNPVELASPSTTGPSPKMCEECRRKHRSYAAVKRAKRRAEKDALMEGFLDHTQTQDRTQDFDHDFEDTDEGFQDMDMEDDSEFQQFMDHHNADQQQQDHQQMATSDEGWPDDVLDPRLLRFSPSSSSLAGALGPVLGVASTSTLPETEEPMAKYGPNLPSRYCSIRGCQAILSGAPLLTMFPQYTVNQYQAHRHTGCAIHVEINIASTQLPNVARQGRNANLLKRKSFSDSSWRTSAEQCWDYLYVEPY